MKSGWSSCFAKSKVFSFHKAPSMVTFWFLFCEEPLKYNFVNVLISTSTHFISFRVCSWLFQILQNLPFNSKPLRDSVFWYIILLRNILVAHAIVQIFQRFTFFFDIFKFQISLWAIIEEFQFDKPQAKQMIFF